MPGRTENQIKNRFHSKIKCKNPVSNSETAQKSPSNYGELSPIASLKDLAELEQTSNLRSTLDSFINRDFYFGSVTEEPLDEKENIYFSEQNKEGFSESRLLCHDVFLPEDSFPEFF